MTSHKYNLLPLFGILLLSCCCVNAANILCLFSSTTTSHLIVHMSTAKVLADNGHKLTVVTALKPVIEPHENITQLLIPPTETHLKLYQTHMKKTVNAKTGILSFYITMFTQPEFLLGAHYDFIVDPKLKAIYESPNANFDLVIVGFFFNDFQLGVAAKLNVPVIVSWVGVPIQITDSMVGNINDPAFVPSFNMPLGARAARTMSFRLRLRNLLTYWLYTSLNYLIKCLMNYYYERAFGNYTNLPSYNEMRKNISLVFTNYHSVSEGPIRPSVPQYIEIGGIQIKEQPKALPTDLAEFFNNASAGVILFSLGTNLKESYIQPHIVQAIFNVLSSLPQLVIWKCSDPVNTPGKATNILYKQWLPQDDILAHPKMRLFITHAGKGGIAESQYHGVPMLALPVFADQPGNANAMVAAGFGLSLDLLTLNEQSLLAAIREVLGNSQYRTNVRRFSEIYRDRPMTAHQSLTYWTEYVLKHKGANHLQSPWVHMNFIERNNLDVYAALLLVVSAALLLLGFALYWACHFVQTRKSYQKLAQSNVKTKTN